MEKSTEKESVLMKTAQNTAVTLFKERSMAMERFSMADGMLRNCGTRVNG